MERLRENLYVETKRRGANHGFVTTSDGIVMIDTPYKPSEALQLKADLEARGVLRYVINTEPHRDHWSGNRFYDAPVVTHEGVRQRILETDVEDHRARVASMGPGEGDIFTAYPSTLPAVTYTGQMTLYVGDHTFRLLHMPGHTPYQTAVLIEEEGVVFTSDNVFGGVHTWLQEANPEDWLRALDSLRALDADTLVPGHGAICGKEYLDTQAAVIQEWVAYVKGAVERGMTRQDAIEQLTAFTDRFPMDVGQDGMAPKVMQDNVANLYDYLTHAGIHSGG